MGLINITGSTNNRLHASFIEQTGFTIIRDFLNAVITSYCLCQLRDYPRLRPCLDRVLLTSARNSIPTSGWTACISGKRSFPTKAFNSLKILSGLSPGRCRISNSNVHSAGTIFSARTTSDRSNMYSGVGAIVFFIERPFGLKTARQFLEVRDYSASILDRIDSSWR